MNVNERKKMVLAMEYITRQINDEDVFEGWLMCGVGDGDIPYGSIDVDDVDEWYIDDNNFKDLMSCFLRRMAGAYNSGGLYCDKVLSESRKKEDNYE